MTCKYKPDTRCTDSCDQGRCVFRFERMFFTPGERMSMKPRRPNKHKKNRENHRRFKNK